MASHKFHFCNAFFLVGVSRFRKLIKRSNGFVASSYTYVIKIPEAV